MIHKMKAVVFDTYGDASVLKIAERPKPIPGEHEVLIRVVAAGVNRPDIIQRKGYYPAPDGVVQDILGLEVSGIIEQVGKDVRKWQVGDQVCALVAGGGYAEYVVAHEGSCLPIPEGISLQNAAALPEVLFTVWHNVFQRGNLYQHESVLIYGGSGGIGSMAIQLSHIYGCRVVAVAGSAEKADYCRALGADHVLNYKADNIVEQWGSETIDVILDSVGGPYLSANLDLLKAEGRLVYINAMEGGHPELDIKKVMRKRLHITGSTLRARSYDFKQELAEDIQKRAFPLLAHARFKDMVGYCFPMEQACEAHRLMESRDFMGKIILTF